VLHVPEARAVHRSGASSKSRLAAASRIEYHRSLDLFLSRRRGRASARLAACVRFSKSLISLLWLVPASLFSSREKDRLRERERLLRWYLRGRPKGWGLADSPPARVDPS